MRVSGFETERQRETERERQRERERETETETERERDRDRDREESWEMSLKRKSFAEKKSLYLIVARLWSLALSVTRLGYF